MDIVDSIIQLRSIRSFKSKKIPSTMMNKILEAGRNAPTTRNIQPWHFIIVTDNLLKQKLSHETAGFIVDAAVTIIGCVDLEQSSTKSYNLEVAIAMQSMVLAAWVQGIGSCWVEIPANDEEMKTLLEIPHKMKVVAMIAFGYPKEIPKSPWKKPLDTIFHYNSFLNP